MSVYVFQELLYLHSAVSFVYVFSCSLLCLSALNAKSDKKHVLIESLLQATKRLDEHETIRGTGVGEVTVGDWCRNRAKTDILKTLSCANYVPVQ
jgi:hypothetical protein